MPIHMLWTGNGLHEAKHAFTVGIENRHTARFVLQIRDYNLELHRISTSLGTLSLLLIPDTSGTEPGIDFMSSTVQSGGQRTRGMNQISS
jgi:hypothetical protein